MTEEQKAKMRAGRERALAERRAAKAAGTPLAVTEVPAVVRRVGPQDLTPRPTPNQERKTIKAAERLAAEARAQADAAATAARAAAEAADRINRRIPNPAPVRMIVGAPPPARGNARKFGDEAQRTYFDALARGLTKLDACKLAGVTRQTTKNYRDKDPSFAEAEHEAEQVACELVEEALFEAAKQGNVEAIKLWLFNRAPERWKPAQKLQLEISGQVDHMHDSAARTEHIASLEATLLARVALHAETPALEPGILDAEVVD
jgi:hypothetical protein